MLAINNTIEKNHIDIKSNKKETDNSKLFKSNKKKEIKKEEELQEIYKELMKDNKVIVSKKMNHL